MADDLDTAAPAPGSGGQHAYQMRPEIRARIRLFTTAEGGRKGPIPGPWFGCPTRIGAEYFDCRLQTVPPGPIPLGATVAVHMQFLSPHLVLPLLAVGDTFALWELRTIAEGVVLELLHPQCTPDRSPLP